MKKIKLMFKSGNFIESEIIQDITKFRGFYYLMDDGKYVVAKGNSSAIVGLKDMSYTRGYELTDGEYIEEHLFNKLLKGEKLSRYELLDFYDKVSLVRPYCRRGNFDFRSLLYKHTNIQFWTLNETPTKKEVEIFNDSAVIADTYLFGGDDNE